MLTVMLVDDDAIVRTGMCEVIDWHGLGCEVIAQAEDGNDALAVLGSLLKPPDIIFTDVVMPGMSGLVLASEVAHIYPWIKVVMISGHDEASYVRQALKNEVVDYLLKPFSMDDIAHVIARIRDKLNNESLVLSNDPQPLADAAGYVESVLDAVSARDKDAALMQLHALFYVLRANNLQSMFFVTTLCLNIILGMINIIAQQQPDEDTSFLSARLSELSRAGNAAALEHQVAAALTAALERMGDNSSGAGVVRKAVRLLEQNYSANITVASLAAQLYVSENYLQLLFKRELKLTIRRYITNLRIEHAKAMLRDTDEKVYQIGEKVGYKDVDYFTNTFRKATGLTPNQYRDSYR